MAIHVVAAAGYAVAGDDYERARPTYPPAAIDALRRALDLGAGSVVVELGAGTGKLTRQLASDAGLWVATEPVAAMRDRLLAATDGPVVASTAEAVPVAAGRADTVVAATAFHWFRGPEALAEIARVLRPGGGLGLLWNNPDRSVDWVAEIWSIVDGYRGPVPGNRDKRWEDAFSTTAAFGPLRNARFHHAVALDVDGLLARVGSISFIASLPGAERERVFASARDIVAGTPALAGAEVIHLPYLTDLYWCTRTGPGRL